MTAVGADSMCSLFDGWNDGMTSGAAVVESEQQSKANY
jgi:hypothetical protein